MEKKPAGSNQSFSVEQGFLEEYQRFVLERGINEKTAKWFTNWIKQFARYLKNVPLHDCAEADVKGFLDQLDRREDIHKWQVKQARHALRLLFKDFLQAPWASQKTAAKPDKLDESGPLPIKQPSLPQSRSELSPKEASSQYNEALQKLTTEMRYRHYSLSTERTYAKWAQRFLKFHNGKPIKQLSAGEVKAYLEHLAVEKQVSSGTQNQALLKAVSGQQSAFI